MRENVHCESGTLKTVSVVYGRDNGWREDGGGVVDGHFTAHIAQRAAKHKLTHTRLNLKCGPVALVGGAPRLSKVYTRDYGIEDGDISRIETGRDKDCEDKQHIHHHEYYSKLLQK